MLSDFSRNEANALSAAACDVGPLWVSVMSSMRKRLPLIAQLQTFRRAAPSVASGP